MKKIFYVALITFFFAVLSKNSIAKNSFIPTVNNSESIQSKDISLKFYNLNEDGSSLVGGVGSWDMVVDSLRITVDKPSDQINLRTLKLYINERPQNVTPTLYPLEDNKTMIDLGYVIHSGLGDGLHIVEVELEGGKVQASFSVDFTPPEIILKDTPTGQEAYVVENGSGLLNIKAEYATAEGIQEKPLFLIQPNLYKTPASIDEANEVVWYEAQDKAGNISILSSQREDQYKIIERIYNRFPHLLKTLTSHASTLVPPQSDTENWQISCNIPQHIIMVKLYNGLIDGDREAKHQEAEAQLLLAYAGFNDGVLTILNPQLSRHGYSTFGITPFTIGGQPAPGEVRLYDINNLYGQPPPGPKSLYQINDAAGNLIGTGIDVDKFMLNAGNVFQGFKNIFDVPKGKDDMLIFVFDELKSSIGEDPYGVAHMTEGYIFLDSGKIHTTAHTFRDLLYAHEIGHILGLEHFRGYVGNMMTEGLIIQGDILEQNQAMAIVAHVCGEPNARLTFRLQSGHFGINIHTSRFSRQYSFPLCENGFIGENEQCDESLYKIGEPCVDPNARPIPTWPDQNGRICMPDCTCQEMIGDEPQPPPQPQDGSSIGGGGGAGKAGPKGPMTPEGPYSCRKMPNGPRKGQCAGSCPPGEVCLPVRGVSDECECREPPKPPDDGLTP